jgi:hypothetical protein
MCSSSLVAANPDIRRSLDKGGLVQEGGMGLTLLLHGPSHLADVCLHSVCITHLEARAEASMGGARQKHDSGGSHCSTHTPSRFVGGDDGTW